MEKLTVMLFFLGIKKEQLELDWAFGRDLYMSSSVLCKKVSRQGISGQTLTWEMRDVW